MGFHMEKVEQLLNNPFWKPVFLFSNQKEAAFMRTYASKRATCPIMMEHHVEARLYFSEETEHFAEKNNKSDTHQQIARKEQHKTEPNASSSGGSHS